MKHIYLDNAATTPMSAEVVATMMDQIKNDFGNASSVHAFGRKARSVLDDARHVVAQSINANDDEIVFTAGGTESNNTAWMQTAIARKNLGRRIITTAIEHESIMQTAAWLGDNGYDIVYLPVNEQGEINMADLKAALTDDTILVSIMTGNNEVGSTMPIHEIGELLKDHQAWFHTDAVQAFGLLDIDVKRDHIDMLSTSAHKINGPKQMGFLYRRDGISFPSFIKGGNQEDKRRAGTENVPAIAGFATAVKALTPAEKAHRQEKYAEFKQYVIDGLTKVHVNFELNGSLKSDNLQHVINLWIKGIPNDVTLTNLDLADVAVSAGSACTAGSLDPSHVLVAMFGKDNPRVMQSIRLSFGCYTTTADLDAFIEAMAAMAARLQPQMAGRKEVLMTFEQTVQVPGDDRIFTLSDQLKKYTLRDLGFMETNAGGFSLERPLDPAAGLAKSIKLRVLINKQLNGFKIGTVNPSGTGNVNIYTNANHDELVEQYGYQIDNLIERHVIAVQTK